MQSVHRKRSLGEAQDERDKSFEEAAFTIPRKLRLRALIGILMVIAFCLGLLSWDAWDINDEKDPSKTDLAKFLFVLAIAGSICSLEWEKFPFRITKIGPIELGDVVSAQASERARDISELRKRVEALESALTPDKKAEFEAKHRDCERLKQSLEQFLSDRPYNFSPERITKFDEFKNDNLDEVRRALQEMVAEKKAEIHISKAGDTLYRIASVESSLS